MTIHYRIYLDLDIVFVICRGKVSGAQYSMAMEAMFLQPGYKHGIIRIVDAYFASKDLNLQEMRSNIKYQEGLVESSIPQDHTILLSRNDSMHDLIAAFKLMSPKMDLKFDVFTTLQYAIRFFGIGKESGRDRNGVRGVPWHLWMKISSLQLRCQARSKSNSALGFKRSEGIAVGPGKSWQICLGKAGQ